MRIKQADNNIIQVVLGCNAERGQKFWTWTQAVQYRLKGTYVSIESCLKVSRVTRYIHIGYRPRAGNPTIFKEQSSLYLNVQCPS